jgi:hypothetical protein
MSPKPENSHSMPTRKPCFFVSRSVRPRKLPRVAGTNRRGPERSRPGTCYVVAAPPSNAARKIHPCASSAAPWTITSAPIPACKTVPSSPAFAAHPNSLCSTKPRDAATPSSPSAPNLPNDFHFPERTVRCPTVVWWPVLDWQRARVFRASVLPCSGGFTPPSAATATDIVREGLSAEVAGAPHVFFACGVRASCSKLLAPDHRLPTPNFFLCRPYTGGSRLSRFLFRNPMRRIPP